MKVMIANDSRMARRVIRSSLPSEGIEIVECTCGQEAIDGYPVHRPDLVLMDLERKHVDGFEATRQIKSRFPDTRIMF
ncbi:MAG: response regulator [Verrucomicrobia bacterium]|nr:response regulator [Verrucomicrobiota bacterium]